MCGFSGYLALHQPLAQDTAVIRQMIALQHHRGPDDSGITGISLTQRQLQHMPVQSDATFAIADVNLWFGFNRLSILDLSPNGHQPMVSPDQQVVLMMNGELYNAFDFRDELIAKGYQFKSQTDTEVALHLYREYGIDGLLERLNGMFAFAIADLRLQKLFLARDRFGIKPLYILQEDNRIAFSSEMKSFKALPDFRFTLDEEGLSEFMLFRNRINRTLFQHITNLEQGCYATISPTQSLSIKRFYSIDQEKPAMLRNKEARMQLEQSLKNSVQRQMMADVKLGCQLSGGVDSSLVTYFANTLVPQGSLETISIVFDDARFTEKKYIDRVADQLQLKAHQYTLTGDYYFDVMDKATWHFEQPINHPNTIGIYLLSQEAKKHVTVLLSGEGADEALAGYSRFVQAKQHPYFSKNFLRQFKKNKDTLGKFISLYASKEDRLILGASFGKISALAKVYPDFSWDKALSQRRDIMRTLSAQDKARQRKYELLTYLPDLLMRQDKMSMAHSIENRVPFLDNEMVSTALQIAEEELIVPVNGKLEAKKILKDLCADTFDQSFAYREKMGFGIPLREFFGSPEFTKRWKEEILPSISRRKLFDASYLDQLVNSLKHIAPEALDSIWIAVGFELWAKQYLD
jgi:asparagine synthase (glutamine-hydrolysing)